MAEFDAKNVSPLDWGVIGGGAVALIAMFMPWYGYQSDCPGIPGVPCSVNAWDAGFSAWFGSLLVIAAGVLVLLRVLGRQLPELPIGTAFLIWALAGMGAFLILMRVLTFDAVDVLGVEIGRKIGAWLGLLAGIIAAASAFLSFKASGEKPPWDSSKMPGGAAAASSPGSYAPPPPATTVYPPPPPATSAYPPPPPPPATAPEAGHDHDHDHDHDMNGHDHPH